MFAKIIQLLEIHIVPLVRQPGLFYPAVTLIELLKSLIKEISMSSRYGLFDFLPSFVSTLALLTFLASFGLPIFLFSDIFSLLGGLTAGEVRTQLTLLLFKLSSSSSLKSSSSSLSCSLSSLQLSSSRPTSSSIDRS